MKYKNYEVAIILARREGPEIFCACSHFCIAEMSWDITPTDALCNGGMGSVQINIQNDPGDEVYNWKNIDTGVEGFSNDQNFQLPVGNYTIWEGTGCVAPQNVSISQPGMHSHKLIGFGKRTIKYNFSPLTLRVRCRTFK